MLKLERTNWKTCAFPTSSHDFPLDRPLTLQIDTLFSLKVPCSKLWQCQIKFTQKPHPARLSLLPRDSVFQHRPGGWVYIWVWATPRSCAPGTAPIPAWQWTHTPVHTWGLRLWTATSSPAFVSSINSWDWHKLREEAVFKKKKSVYQSNVRYVGAPRTKCYMKLPMSGSIRRAHYFSYLCVISPSQLSQSQT